MDNRQPLDVARLRAELVDNGPFARLEHSMSTGSTNTDLVAATHDGTPAWTVFLTEEQVAGRGRMGRRFEAPAGSQLTLSFLIRPPASAISRLGTMALITGLALVDVINQLPRYDADAATRAGNEDSSVGLKWPNDLLADGRGKSGGRKLCGILAEAVDLGSSPAVVIGLGLNTSLRSDELPVAHASSLELEGIVYERTELAINVLRALYKRMTQWECGEATLMDEYRAASVTIGQNVRAILPGDKELLGRAETITNDGHLVVVEEDGTRHVLTVGDITHLRLQ
ncbi:biotin--[acetyl-CoA-carboxylase] ligase [Corynebacterium kutscheri]|uniref:biotin--[acetyl-CoA-carboxylase] ligase n=1 Tax=Corynebacterium kutscheri TaxID=35755 RepID=UPI0037C0640B